MRQAVYFLFTSMACGIISSNAEADFNASVLSYHIEPYLHRTSPPVRVVGDSLHFGDLAKPSDPLYPWSALEKTAGLDDSQRANFALAAANDADVQVVSNALNCAQSPTSPMTIWTYLKPYMIRQGDYQAWINGYGSKQLLKAPKGSATNPYDGNLICPVDISLTQANLQKTFGRAALRNLDPSQPDSLTLVVDNSVNPYRWSAPLNVVHHVEQPSMAVALDADPASLPFTNGILRTYNSSGIAPKNPIYLDYVVEVSVEDLRQQMHELTLKDFLANSPGTDLLSQMASLVQNSNLPFGAFWRNYFHARMETPSVQMSVGVNFRQDGVFWLEQDFMIASMNYQNATGGGVTPNSTLNSYINEGGNNAGGTSWYRLKLNALTDLAPLLPKGSKQLLKQGSGYWEIPDGGGKATLWGTIDLSEFVKTAIGNQFFPGSNASSWAPALGDPFNNLQVNWASFIMEVHGPFRVKATVRALNVHLAAQPMPNS